MFQTKIETGAAYQSIRIKCAIHTMNSTIFVDQSKLKQIFQYISNWATAYIPSAGSLPQPERLNTVAILSLFPWQLYRTLFFRPASLNPYLWNTTHYFQAVESPLLLLFFKCKREVSLWQLFPWTGSTGKKKLPWSSSSQRSVTGYSSYAQYLNILSTSLLYHTPN